MKSLFSLALAAALAFVMLTPGESQAQLLRNRWNTGVSTYYTPGYSAYYYTPTYTYPTTTYYTPGYSSYYYTPGYNSYYYTPETAYYPTTPYVQPTYGSYYYSPVYTSGWGWRWR